MIYIRHSLCRVLDPPDKEGHRHAHYELLEPKSKKGVREIPMVEEVFEALKLQKARQDENKIRFRDVYRDSDFVFVNQFGDHLPQRTFVREYHAIQERYDLPNIRFHDLRHSFATLLVEANVPMRVVQELLGHSTITTSMDLYAHVSGEMKNQALTEMQKLNKEE